MKFIPSLLLLGMLAMIVACNQSTVGKELTTESGVKYIIHKAGNGEKPEPGDIVFFHAQIRKGDEIVNKSRDFPDTPALQIPLEKDPMKEGPTPVEDVMALLSVGDSATVFIDLNSFPEKPFGFEDVEELQYDLVIIKIKKKAEYDAELTEMQRERDEAIAASQAAIPEVKATVEGRLAEYKAGKLAGLKTTASGLKYLILNEGEGPTPQMGNTVKVEYYGVLMDGTNFDASFNQGRAFEFPLGMGQVIPGWDEGIGLLNKGTKAILFIPAALAYGEMGAPPTIPANSELAFYVELKDFE